MESWKLERFSVCKEKIAPLEVRTVSSHKRNVGKRFINFHVYAPGDCKMHISKQDEA